MPQKKYYVTGNTGAGFVNYLPDNLQGIDHVLLLKHESHKLKTAVLKALIDYYKPNKEVEVLLSPLGKDYLDGFIVREDAFAVVDDSLDTNQLRNTTVIDLLNGMNDKKDYLVNNKTKRDFQAARQSAYDEFSKGLEIHDELESVYIDEMDFNRADELAEQLQKELFSDVSVKEGNSIAYHRLFGTNTPQGAVNVVPELIASVENIYFIKGRAGTGKSTLMKKIIHTIQEYGYGMELYYCSFDPKSIDMVLVAELNFCLFDSTDPHEFFPTKPNHKIVDMYKETVKEGTDEKYAEKIKKITSLYKRHMKQGIEQLKIAQSYLKQVEDQYSVNELPIGKTMNRITDIL